MEELSRHSSDVFGRVSCDNNNKKKKIKNINIPIIPTFCICSTKSGRNMYAKLKTKTLWLYG